MNQSNREANGSAEQERRIDTIFDEVPGGLALYRWDGTELKVLRLSRHYREQYGYSMLNQSGSPDFQRIHPDDIADYQKAIAHALAVTHRLEYVFRVWDQTRRRYGWTQINAVSKPQPDGTSYVYAVYTDVTERKIAEFRLAKSKASALAALGAAEQSSFEYDPAEHTCTVFLHEATGYQIGSVVENYPECFRENKFLHPDDVELLISTVRRIDGGAPHAHCIVRADRSGEYRWNSVSFDAFFDWEKNRPIALITVVDITPRVQAMQDYEERIRSLLAAQENILSMCTINVTRNTCELMHTEPLLLDAVEQAQGLEETLLCALPCITDEESRERYRSTFCRENLLRQAGLGNMHLQQEVLLRLAENRCEWVTVAVEMVKTPGTNEIGGASYCKSTQSRHMARALLSGAQKLDYIYTVVVMKDTDEYYVYQPESGGFGGRRENFWQASFSAGLLQCSDEALADMRQAYEKERMLRHLESHEEFSYAFDSGRHGEELRRLEVKFRYLDRARKMLLVTLRDITDQRLQEQHKFENDHDALTGLLNRRTVFEEGRRLLEQYPDETFVMLHCDVRHFHLYNTFFGESAGDKLLRRIAEVIRIIEKGCCCFAAGRMESDVFCLVFPMEETLFEENVRMCFEELKRFSPDFPLELAIGAYEITDPAMSMEAMFARATIAAKSEEKNLFGLISRYDEDMEQTLKATQQITSEMVNAIDQEQFLVYFQPKVSLRTEKLVGAEALVRWKHKERGMIPTGAYIPVFEKNGFIAKLDRYMWEHTCRILRRWQDEGRTMLPVSVNISRVSMYSPATVPFLKELVERYRVDPAYLELELTETAYMDDPEDLKRMLRELQDYGFKILMDDFGSGYSSLNTLKDLPVDMLKLDMKFLSDSRIDPRGNAVLSSVVRMSRMLRLPIVAEGVVNREQAEYLRELGCEYGQGYLFARPMPVEDYERLLAQAEPETEQLPEKVPADVCDRGYESAVRLEAGGHYALDAEQIIRAVDNTSLRMFMYFPQTKLITVPERTCALYGCAPVYANMPDSFAEDYVHPEDYAVFRELYSRIDRGEPFSDAVFHSKDFNYCNHVTLTTVSRTEDGKPREVLGLIENLSNQFRNEQFIQKLQGELSQTAVSAEMDDALKNIAMAIGSQYYAVYYIWLESRTYVCLQEKLPGILGVIGERGDYEPAWDKYIHGYIEESEWESMEQFVDIESLAQRVDEQDGITHVYRRKEVGWTRGQFIPAKRDEQGRLQTVIYTVSDINSEVESERKRTEAEQEAMRDPMTGLWNRKGFEHYIDTKNFTERPTGLLLFDIDRFKGVNDRFGHEMGDTVIKTVCNQVRNELRRNDLVFRMGGDEFAVLLYDCKDGVWSSICRKFAQIHADVRAALPAEVPDVTLSVGLCVNPEGYGSRMYSLADRALYHTKQNGRGGCTMIDLDGTILQEWHDSSSILRRGDVLERNSTMTWRLDIPKKEGLPFRAYGDELTRGFLGVSPQITPEEGYQAWFSHIDPECLDIVRAAVRTAIADGSSEVVYDFDHPEKGRITLRCSTSLDSETEDYDSLIGYAHITSGVHVFTRLDVSDRVRNALDELYFCNFYIHLHDLSVTVFKAQPYMAELLSGCADAAEAIAAYAGSIVTEESRDTVTEFMDLSTLPQRLKDTNLISAVYHDPNIGWARALFVAVDRGADGLPETVSLVVENV